MKQEHQTLFESCPATMPRRRGSQDMAQVVKTWVTPDGGAEVMVGWSAYTPTQARVAAADIVKAAETAEAYEREHGKHCPDSGICYHGELCMKDGTCFRVRCCGPLTGKYPADVWPASVKEAYGCKRQAFTVLYENPAMRGRAQEHEVLAWDSQDAIWETARWLGTKFPKVMEGARILAVRGNEGLED